LLGVDRPFPAVGRFPADPYVGSKVCAECHPGESALHDRSGHARTLGPAGRRALARRLDGSTTPDPEERGTLWSYHYRDGRLHVERLADGQASQWVVDYAFGSGHHATTFVNLVDPSQPKILEHRLTYYTASNSFGVTPGQGAHIRSSTITPYGREPSPQEARKCFRCHSTQLSAGGDDRIDERTMIPNVSCERCHGPGRAHVAAARRGAGEAELALPFGVESWNAETLLTLCGTCHRHPSRARPGQIRADDPRLARFQPVGLMQSKCYLQSGGAFTCVTCHDPHARASADRASYDTVCLLCHAGAAREPARAGGTRAAGSTCSVSPRVRCVECHMPRVESGQHVLFTDHWIRIRREAAPPTETKLPPPNLDFPDSD
jgi:hypothetical protein